MEILNRFSLRVKLYGLVAVAIIAMLSLLAAIGLYYHKMKLDIRFKERVLETLQEALDTRVAEKSYLQFHANDLTNTVRRHEAQMFDYIAQLDATAPDNQVRAHLDVLRQAVQTYQTQFDEVVALYRLNMQQRQEKAAALVVAGQTLADMIAAIEAKKSMLQMEGASLTVAESELTMVLRECRQYIVTLQSLYQQFVITGAESEKNAFEKYMTGDARLSVNSMEKMARRVGRIDKVDMDAGSKSFRASLTMFIQSAQQSFELFAKEKQKVEQLDVSGGRLRTTADALATLAAAAAAKSERAAILSSMWTLAISVLIFSIMAVGVSSRMSRSLKAVGDHLGLLATGDFSRFLDARLLAQKDEIGALAHAMQNMIHKISSTLIEVQESVGQVSSGSRQISDASQSLSQGATESASSLEEITSSMTQVASQTKTNAENANQANGLSKAARDAAETGSNQMKDMVLAMNDINASSRQIAKIIKVIDDIAFQTNLLALNAAVEAARAGRHGKGFAVVADEVRNLAGRSAKAAKETAELIESSGRKVENGLSVATRASESFKEIVGGIVKVTDLVGEIAAASNEQAQGVSQINQGLGQIDQVTQQNTANAEETASAAEELAGQASQMQDMIQRFKLASQAKETVAIAQTPTRSRSASLPPPSGSSWAALPVPTNDLDVLIPWTEALSVGVDKMNDEHKVLVGLVNQLYAALKQGKAREALGGILDELIDYTRVHFSDEESLLKLYRYPGLEEQEQAHRRLVAKAEDLQQRYQAGASLGVDVMNFLRDWLTNHIQKMDKRYGTFLREHGVG